MKLVFIHGWGLAPNFWDEIAAGLPGYAQTRVNLGYYGAATEIPEDDNCVLVGHSLGFVYGMAKKKNWRGWISVNSFPRFVKSDDKPGCTSAAELRDIRRRLDKDAVETLRNFYGFIGANPPSGVPDTEKLREGLDMLRDLDAGDTSNVPRLVLASRNDPLVPDTTSEALAGNREVKWDKNGGHVLPQSNPARCVLEMAMFLKTNALRSVA